MSEESKKEESWRWFRAGFESVARDWLRAKAPEEEIRAKFESIWRKEPPP